MIRTGAAKKVPVLHIRAGYPTHTVVSSDDGRDLVSRSTRKEVWWFQHRGHGSFRSGDGALLQSVL